ncbi:tyrosine-type recombinase/integrase [Sphingobium sp. SYK-6]|uniref:tyrosine-type recombinase/integrase n=1 Tax=Sphingobium sp. (strain NBRC 103272 / SYK-6) TaxID=627192 RepID=UPI0009FE7FE5|nr:site-specific integrase [Sphingobium sp. SYK-6]
MSWTVYSNDGQRKYLTHNEIKAFLRSAKRHSASTYAFCWILAITGCRISEALSLTDQSIDFESKQVIIRCLKKRQKRVYRAIPLPTELLVSLNNWMKQGVLERPRLWPWSRMTAYRHVCQIMREAGIAGSFATPKGLRHGFAVRAIQSDVPLNLVQRWLGHADIKTTAIYTNATGPEERELASRLWSGRSERGVRHGQSGPKRSVIRGTVQATPAGMEAPATVRLTPHFLTPYQDVDSCVGGKGSTSELACPPSGSGKFATVIRHREQSGAIPSCCLLHFWLNCNMEKRYISTSYSISSTI